MNWKHKALLQFAFSNIPFGERLNYLGQRYVTRSLPTANDKCATIVSIAKEHIQVVQVYLCRQLEKATFYEFGAGWDLIIPLAFYAFGVERQILVDVRRLVRPYIVNHTIKQLQQMASDLGLPRKPECFLDSKMWDFLDSLKKYYGIEYRSPCDARYTGLEGCSVDCITSTNTLEHIPPQDIPSILRECCRILRDDGLMSFRIDYQDHWSYFDKSISVYNFLRYSDKAWRFFNPALHYQNRLRHKDYLKLFEETGCEIVEERRMDGT